ncbi:PEGA domain-containing protein, partial [Brachyspira hampsonii]|nr:PEGA domain-containing protein [Brachyspira hampsonii]
YTSRNEGSNIAIITNYETTTYTNWGDVRSNVQLITPETEGFFLETNEMIFEHNGSNVILKGTNDFIQKVDIGKTYYEYFGDDIKKYIFTRDSDIAVFGSVKYDRPNINIVTYIAYIKDRKITSYSITIPEAKIDEQIPNYALDIANRISYIDKTGVIAIDVSPEDAFVYVDDVLIGKSGQTLYVPALTTNNHRFTIKKEYYETIDTMLSFEKPNENILLNFKLKELSKRARVQINIPGEEESSVIINGIKETPTNVINRYFGFGTYSIKITNTNYIDYYGTFTVNSTNSLVLTPNMKKYHEPTLADRIFKNYERNTKIFLGLTIASAIFTVGTYIYAGEVLDSTMVNYYNQYKNEV